MEFCAVHDDMFGHSVSDDHFRKLYANALSLAHFNCIPWTCTKRQVIFSSVAENGSCKLKVHAQSPACPFFDSFHFFSKWKKQEKRKETRRAGGLGKRKQHRKGKHSREGKRNTSKESVEGKLFLSSYSEFLVTFQKGIYSLSDLARELFCSKPKKIFSAGPASHEPCKIETVDPVKTTITLVQQGRWVWKNETPNVFRRGSVKTANMATAYSGGSINLQIASAAGSVETTNLVAILDSKFSCRQQQRLLENPLWSLAVIGLRTCKRNFGELKFRFFLSCWSSIPKIEKKFWKRQEN